MTGTNGGQKSALDPLELDRGGVSSHVVLGTELESSVGATSAPHC